MRTLACLATLTLALSLAAGCGSSDGDDEASSSVDALTSLTAAQCKTPTVDPEGGRHDDAPAPADSGRGFGRCYLQNFTFDGETKLAAPLLSALAPVHQRASTPAGFARRRTS